MAKKSLFTDLAAFNKNTTLKSVSTRIRQRDGSTKTVDHLASNEPMDDTKETKSNESINDIDGINEIDIQNPPKLRGLSQFPYSYNPSSLKWEVRNDKIWHSVEFSEKRLSQTIYREFSIATIAFNTKDIGGFKELLNWLRSHKASMIIFINIDIEFFDIIIKEKWIQKMYQCTDSQFGRNVKLWKCCCFSSIAIKGIKSSLLYKTDKYFLQIQIYLGLIPFIVSFTNLDTESNALSIEMAQIEDFLKDNNIEECIFNMNTMNISVDGYQECEYILNNDNKDNNQDDNKANEKDLICNRISNLLRTSFFKISGIEYFDDNKDTQSSDISAKCIYFQQ